MMKYLRVVFLGLLILTFMVVPVLAKQTVDPEDDVFAQGTDGSPSFMTGGLAGASPEEVGGPPGGIGVCGIGTQSPVRGGGAYPNYDTIFYPGSNAVPNGPPDPDVAYEYDFGNGHVIGLNGAVYPTDAWVNCPFASYDSKQGGIYPVVRYLGLYYLSDPSGTGWPVVDMVTIWNGCTMVTSVGFSPPLSHSGPECTVRVIDLGAYYRFNRGLTMCVHTRNGDIYQRNFMIGGYGARFEW